MTAANKVQADFLWALRFNVFTTDHRVHLRTLVLSATYKQEGGERWQLTELWDLVLREGQFSLEGDTVYMDPMFHDSYKKVFESFLEAAKYLWDLVLDTDSDDPMKLLEASDDFKRYELGAFEVSGEYGVFSRVYVDDLRVIEEHTAKFSQKKSMPSNKAMGQLATLLEAADPRVVVEWFNQWFRDAYNSGNRDVANYVYDWAESRPGKPQQNDVGKTICPIKMRVFRCAARKFSEEVL
jgi:hypothetical protein